MLFDDNMFVGNTAVDAVYLGNTQVWSAIPADVKAHIARVIVDGGTVPEQDKMVSMVKKLIAANLWNNCVFFGLPLGGVKKDGNQYVSKVYDLKANADLLQATGTAQPKYNSDGSLLYDGGDALVSTNLANNDLKNTVTNFSVCSSFVRTATKSTAQTLMTRSTSLTNRVFSLYISASNDNFKANAIKVYFANSSGAIVRMKAADVSTTLGVKYSTIITYNSMDISLTINGIANAGIYEPSITTGGSIGNTNCPLSLGAWGTGNAYPLTGSLGPQLVFNKILSDPEKAIVTEILEM